MEFAGREKAVNMANSNYRMLGLAGLNIAVAVILSITYLTSYAGRAQILTKETVASFIREAYGVAEGQHFNMDHEAVMNYFMSHMTEKSTFRDTVSSEIPGVDPQTQNLDKKDYIAKVLRELKAKGRHKSSISVDSVQITPNGRMATAMTSSVEKVTIAVKNPDGSTRTLPVTATSYCEKTVGLGNNHIMQIISDACTTELKQMP